MGTVDNLRSAPELAGSAIYPDSVIESDEGFAFLVRFSKTDMIAASPRYGFNGKRYSYHGVDFTLAETNNENAVVMQSAFSFTAPSAVLSDPRTFGVGDRLGIASPGHISALKKYDAVPVLAQQSVRELNFTGRTFADVLAAAAYGVFRTGYKRGYGADGDHLKSEDEIESAIASGCTMITLDCSRFIRRDAALTDFDTLSGFYTPDKQAEERYIGKNFRIGEHVISFSRENFIRAYLIYKEAADYTAKIYKAYFQNRESTLDLELSVDETDTPTEPYQHFFIAYELYLKGALPKTIAPRFCGEFQKGIDYIGSIPEFERKLSVHAAIAEHFGYKLSIHSGSDKFSVFPSVGRCTLGRFHVKTAGTSWLEAMKTVSEHDPGLFRKIHEFAKKDAFDTAKRYYRVMTELSDVPDISVYKDEELPSLLDDPYERQLIHITYGLILSARNENGSYVFKDRLYRLWRENEDAYHNALDKHISKHLKLLYSGFR